LAINAVTGWFIVYPLTPQERRQQMLKRKAIGKFNYSLSYLDLDDDHKEWALELGRRERGEVSPPPMH